MSWEKTRAEYARKARSMPTGQTHVSVLAEDLEYLCEEGENAALAGSAARKLHKDNDALRDRLRNLETKIEALANVWHKEAERLSAQGGGACHAMLRCSAELHAVLAAIRP